MGINWGSNNNAVNDFIEVHAVGFPCASGLEGLGNQITEQYDIQSHITALVVMPNREIAGQFYYPYFPTRDTINNLLLSLGAHMQDCTTGMHEDTKVEHQIKIYPNPANSQVIIYLDMETSAVYHMEIFNNFGECIRSFPVNLSSGKNNFNLDVSSLNAGYYFIKLKVGTKSIASKLFIKQ